MVDKKTDNTEKAKESFFDDINLKEIVKTTNMDILDKYDLIEADDNTTIRKVKIIELPKKVLVKEIKGKPFNKKLWFMTISDNGKLYSLNADSISLRRSIVSLAIKLSKAKTEQEIDFEKILNVLVGICRTKFEDSFGIHTPYNFFPLQE